MVRRRSSQVRGQPTWGQSHPGDIDVWMAIPRPVVRPRLLGGSRHFFWTQFTRAGPRRSWSNVEGARDQRAKVAIVGAARLVASRSSGTGQSPPTTRTSPLGRCPGWLRRASLRGRVAGQPRGRPAGHRAARWRNALYRNHTAGRYSRDPHAGNARIRGLRRALTGAAQHPVGTGNSGDHDYGDAISDVRPGGRRCRPLLDNGPWAPRNRAQNQIC